MCIYNIYTIDGCFNERRGTNLSTGDDYTALYIKIARKRGTAMHVIISNSSKEPIYKQIVDQIKSSILTGDLKEGEALLSIRQLAKDLKVSVITTKRAYEELEKEGFIYSIVGKGSFVAEQNLEVIKEKKLRVIEEQLSAVIDNSKEVGLSLEELKELLEILYEE